MSNRVSRLGSLTGVLFALVVIAAAVSGGETPEANASAAKVVAYYGTHRSQVETSAILFAIAFLVVVLFAGSLRSYLRRTSAAAEGLSALVLAGGVLMAVGAITGSGLEYGLAHNLHALSPTEAQTLNFISNEIFLPLLAGAFVFGIASGLAILRGAALPKWLGWVAIVLGIIVLIPPIGFPALIGFVLWSLIVSILMYLRDGAPAETAQAASSSGFAASEGAA
jgi:hypothetical protein